MRTRNLITAIATGVAALAIAGGTALADQPAPHVGVWHQGLNPITWDTSPYHEGECSGLQPGQVDWHFVMNQVTDPASKTLVANFQNAGVITQVGTVSGSQGNENVSWDIITPTRDTLIPPATTDVIGTGEFNLSHTCAGPAPQVASHISTTIHQGGTVEGGPFTSDPSLGAVVHDSAVVTVDGNTAIPAGSKVQFTFSNGDQAELPVNLADGTVDMALPEGPLHAGSYSYTAEFKSGNPDAVADSVSGPELLVIPQAHLGISTTIHNARHDPVTEVPLGSTVHDTATVTSAVDGFPIAVSFTLNGNGVANGPAEQGVTATSEAAGPLHAGDYTYAASVAGTGDAVNDYVGASIGNEALKVDKGDVQIATHVYGVGGEITGTDVFVGSVVHDSAVVSAQLADFPITGTVTYTLSQAEGTAALPGAETVAVGTDSSPFTVSVWGHYQYSVSYAGNGDYNPATSAAEPFQAYRGAWVSPGFWKSTNGVAAWALVAPITKASLFNSTAGVPPYYSGTALGAKVTLGDVLTGGAGQYGGAAFNAVGAFLTDQLKPYGYMWNGSTTSGLNPIGSGGRISP